MTVSIPKVVAGFETALDQAVAEGATTAALISIVDTDGVNLANGYYGFTIDNDTDYKEYILCTLTGTALTNIFSVSDQGVATTGFANYHRRGATVQITDHVSLRKVIENLTGVTDLDGGVALAYDSTPTLNDGLQLATVQYVLDTVNGGTVNFGAQVVAGDAGETVADGEWVYLNTTDGEWYLTDADDTSKSLNVQIGKARGAGTNGNPITGGVFISGLETVGTYTPGQAYYLSNTAGALSTSAGTNSVLVGYGDANSDLLLRTTPLNAIDAALGTVGTPSSVNKFITEAGTSVDATDQSQTTQNGTFSAGEANATTRHNKLAQSFVPTKTIIRGVNLYKSANTGSFTGTVTVGIFADSAGSPTGAALATKTITNALYLSYAVGEFLALFSSELTVTPGTLYWIVVETSTADTANCINLGTNTAGGYASGGAKYNNTTDGWVAIATIDLYFKTLEGANGKAILADSTGFVPVAIRKQNIATGNIALANSATANVVAHGLGRLPNLIEASVGGGSSAHGTYVLGYYNVAAGTYAMNGFTYNEASSGSQIADTTYLLQTRDNTGSSPANITVAVDENVVIFSADSNSRTITYKIS